MFAATKCGQHRVGHGQGQDGGGGREGSRDRVFNAEASSGQWRQTRRQEGQAGLLSTAAPGAAGVGVPQPGGGGIAPPDMVMQ